MRSASAIAFAAAALALSPTPAIASEICTALDRVVESSRETPAFASLQRALEDGEAPMPGFSAETCSVRPGMQIRCGGFTHRGAFSEWEGIEACPGVASVPPTPRRRSRNTAWRRAYIRSDAPGLAWNMA